MATRGPKPQPSKIRELRRNPGKRAMNKKEPKPEAIPVMDPPSDLPPAGKRQWKAIFPKLAKARLITSVDIPMLKLYCERYATYEEANKHIKKEGLIVASPKGYPMQSPYLSISNKAFKDMVGILTEFGMSPSSRSRTSAVEPESGDDSDFNFGF